jgi:transposase InsO family protein
MYRKLGPLQQWLTDNGSAYTAKETIDFGQQLGLTPCFTPVRSPQSNGRLKRLLKPLSGIMSISTIVPTQKQSWRNSTIGLMTTITIILTRDYD